MPVESLVRVHSEMLMAAVAESRKLEAELFHEVTGFLKEIDCLQRELSLSLSGAKAIALEARDIAEEGNEVLPKLLDAAKEELTKEVKLAFQGQMAATFENSKKLSEQLDKVHCDLALSHFGTVKMIASEARDIAEDSHQALVSHMSTQQEFRKLQKKAFYFLAIMNVATLIALLALFIKG